MRPVTREQIRSWFQVLNLIWWLLSGTLCGPYENSVNAVLLLNLWIKAESRHFGHIFTVWFLKSASVVYWGKITKTFDHIQQCGVCIKLASNDQIAWTTTVPAVCWVWRWACASQTHTQMQKQQKKASPSFMEFERKATYQRPQTLKLFKGRKSEACDLIWVWQNTFGVFQSEK